MTATPAPRASAAPASTAPEATSPRSTTSGAGAARKGGVPRILYVLGAIALGWLAIQAVQQLGNIVAPILLTLNLFIVAYPVQGKLTKLGVPKVIGALLSGLIVFTILLVFFASLVWAMTQLILTVPQYQGAFVKLWNQFLEILRSYGINEGQILRQVQDQFSPSSVVGPISSALSSISGVFSLLAVVVVIIFMVMIDTMSLPQRLQVAARSQPRTVDALTDFARGVRRYWIVSSIFGVICAVLDTAVLWYLQVPLAVVWGLLAFLTNYLPNIGFVIGIIPPVLMALLANSPQTALIVVVAYCVINFVMQSIIQPKFNGDAVGVTATVSFLSLLFWAWVLGPIGALLALPTTLLCKTLLVDIDPEVQWLNSFFASNPETGDPQVDAATGERWDEKDQTEGGATAWVPGTPVGGEGLDTDGDGDIADDTGPKAHEDEAQTDRPQAVADAEVADRQERA